MSDRYPTIDYVRGVAVMGILLMNIIGFAMPERAALTPQNWMAGSWGNDAIWVANFILIDNKMRGLFSVLFGASMLLVIDRTDEAGGNGMARHFRRMFWLLLFGLTHYFFIWNGDILTLYALIGCIAAAFRHFGARRLVALALLAFCAHFALWCLIFARDIEVDRRVQSGPVSAELVQQAQTNRITWGAPGGPETLKEVGLFRSSYPAIVRSRTVDEPDQPLTLLITFGFETLGLMLMGMAMLRSGFLTGGWTSARYRTWMKASYAFSLPGMILLALWCAVRGFDPVVTVTAGVLWSLPFREAMIVGHAALIILATRRFAASPWLSRVGSVGQVALTNYLGTSILMTFIFYGYGLGLFGYVSRAQAYLFCFAAWGIMLAWSKPWLARFRQGPFEWIWRSLTAWRVQPLRR